MCDAAYRNKPSHRRIKPFVREVELTVPTAVGFGDFLGRLVLQQVEDIGAYL